MQRELAQPAEVRNLRGAGPSLFRPPLVLRRADHPGVLRGILYRVQVERRVRPQPRQAKRRGIRSF